MAEKRVIGTQIEKPKPLWLQNIIKKVEKEKEYNEKRRWYQLVDRVKK